MVTRRFIVTLRVTDLPAAIDGDDKLYTLNVKNLQNNRVTKFNNTKLAWLKEEFADWITGNN